MNVTFESEAELEEFVCNNLIKEIARISVRENEDNINIIRYKNQVRLGSYGIADIVIEFSQNGVKESSIVVVELKNVEVKSSDFAQICRYMTCISEVFQPEKEIYGVVIGPKDIREDVSYMPFYFTDITYVDIDSDGKLYDGCYYRDNESFNFNTAMGKK